MKSLLFALMIILMSCTNVLSQKESPMQKKQNFLFQNLRVGQISPASESLKTGKIFVTR